MGSEDGDEAEALPDGVSPFSAADLVTDACTVLVLDAISVLRPKQRVCGSNKNSPGEA